MIQVTNKNYSELTKDKRQLKADIYTSNRLKGYDHRHCNDNLLPLIKKYSERARCQWQGTGDNCSSQAIGIVNGQRYCFSHGHVKWLADKLKGKRLTLANKPLNGLK